MPEEFAHVFEPLRLRHKTLTSRITFGAHTANMAEGGLPGERHIGYYRERALGGAGMIVVEPVPVHRTAVLTRGNFRHDDDAIIPAFRRLTDACREANPDIVMIHQLYHIGQHSDADNSFAPNWSPSGLPSYHDADGSHAVSAAEIEELIEGFVAAAGRAQASGLRRHRDLRRVQRPRRPVLDASGRTAERTSGAGRSRTGCASRREILRRIRERCGEDFIVGLAISADPESEAFPSIAELAEIVAWHDERRLMDYVTCGTGSYFHFEAIIPTSLFDARLGEPFAAALKARRPPRAGPGREPHPDARRGRSRPGRRPCRHGQHRPRPDRRPAHGRQGPSRARRRGAAVHLVQPAVLGPSLARLLDLVPRQPVGGARMGMGWRPVRGDQTIRGGSWSSVAGRPGWRRRASPPSAAIA